MSASSTEKNTDFSLEAWQMSSEDLAAVHQVIDDHMTRTVAAINAAYEGKGVSSSNVAEALTAYMYVGAKVRLRWEAKDVPKGFNVPNAPHIVGYSAVVLQVTDPQNHQDFKDFSQVFDLQNGVRDYEGFVLHENKPVYREEDFRTHEDELLERFGVKRSELSDILDQYGESIIDLYSK